MEEKLAKPGVLLQIKLVVNKSYLKLICTFEILFNIPCINEIWKQNEHDESKNASWKQTPLAYLKRKQPQQKVVLVLFRSHMDDCAFHFYYSSCSFNCSLTKTNFSLSKAKTYNPVQNIWKLNNVFVYLPFTTSRKKLISNITKFIYKLRQELPNDLRLRILGNKKILEKPQNCTGS